MICTLIGFFIIQIGCYIYMYNVHFIIVHRLHLKPRHRQISENFKSAFKPGPDAGIPLALRIKITFRCYYIASR